MPTPCKVLILGASYGSLLAIKLLLAGHTVKLVCLPAEADLINSEGARVRMPVKAAKAWSRSIRASCPASFRQRPAAIDPAEYEPRRARDAGAPISLAWRAQLLDAVARAKVPCMSIMNMPPRPTLARSRRHRRRLPSCYTDPTVWDRFDPSFMTLCSPDPQPSVRRGESERPAGEAADQLQVGALSSDAHTANPAR